jgi:hypothetical protein
MRSLVLIFGKNRRYVRHETSQNRFLANVLGLLGDGSKSAAGSAMIPAIPVNKARGLSASFRQLSA